MNSYTKSRQLMSQGSGIMAPPPGESGSVLDRAEALFGFQPGEVLSQLRDAQAETTRLRREEAQLAAELASYRARFAYPSHFEHERKLKLSVLKEARRAEYSRMGEKITESALDEYAHAHPEYRQFLDAGLRDRQKMEQLEANLVEVRGKIETAKGAELYFERATRMGESLIFHSAREAAHG